MAVSACSAGLLNSCLTLERIEDAADVLYKVRWMAFEVPVELKTA